MSGLSANPGGPLLGRWEKPFEMLLGSATALILACIMLLTCVDVAGRYVFSEPVPGALEVTELMMGALIFASLPMVTLRNQQVTIDLFSPFIPAAVKPALHVLIHVASGLCMGVISWRLWVKAGQMFEQGDTTAVLQLKVWPLVYFMSALAAVTAAILILMIRQKDAAGGSGEV
ncbi:MAG: TRAP transporter small permease [Rhodocyclaceae bacterium]|nr:MAG: TRAP transporter small permease [Rhodocyclaceae bacterium]